MNTAKKIRTVMCPPLPPPCRYNLPDQCRLKMTEADIKTGKELLQEAFIMKNPEWMKELQRMVSSYKYYIGCIAPSMNYSNELINYIILRSRRKRRQRSRLYPLLAFSTSQKCISPASE